MDSFVVGSSIKYCLGNKRSLTGARNSQVFDWLDLVCSESVPVMGGQKGWVYGTIREAGRLSLRNDKGSRSNRNKS